MTVRTAHVPGSDGRPVRLTLHGPVEAPAVLLLHGFKGFREWGFWPWVAERVAEAGLKAIRVDYSHNGCETRDFDRLDLFLLDTWTRHQEDLDALAEAVPGPIGLLGHSRGGTDAILFAAREPRVRCVAAWAAPADTRRAPEDHDRVLREKGYYPFVNARTGQTMPVARSAFEDAHRHAAEAAARRLGRPLLLVHGADDEAVPPADARALAAAHGSAEVLEVPRGTHTFGAVHPFQGPTRELSVATAASVAFLARHLLATRPIGA